MQCIECTKPATHLVHKGLEPHCQEHMLEALCSVATAVIDIECYTKAVLDAKWAAIKGA